MDESAHSYPIWASVIVPIKDERDSLVPLTEQLIKVLDSRDESRSALFEIVFIDDGSTDGSSDVLDRLAADDPRVRVFHFARNFGQSSALDAGFKHSVGALVITIDGDLQNDPADIDTLLPYVKTFDLVCGWRTTRHDSLVRMLSSRIANAVRSAVTGDRVHDTGCSLKIFRRAVVDRLQPFNGMHRFFPALALMHGFTIIEVPVRHYPRIHGLSKYGVGNRLFKGLYDLFAVRWMKTRVLRYTFRTALPPKAGAGTGRDRPISGGRPIVLRFPVALVLSIACLITPAWADFETGMDAYERGNYATALSEWSPLAEEGNAQAQLHLGMLYHQARGVPQDSTTARQWYEKAAAQGYARAQFNLGVLYANGDGVQQDYATARQWYEKAAAQGYASGQNNLGYLYADGKGVPKDETKGVEWIRKAAEQRDATGQASLGEMYRDGRGVPQDDVQAYMWFTLGAANGAKRAAVLRDELAIQMTSAQLAEAQKLAREWKPKTPSVPR